MLVESAKRAQCGAGSAEEAWAVREVYLLLLLLLPQRVLAVPYHGLPEPCVWSHMGLCRVEVM